MVKVTRFGEEVEYVGRRLVKITATREDVRTVYKDRDGNCFWFDKEGRKHYVDC